MVLENSQISYAAHPNTHPSLDAPADGIPSGDKLNSAFDVVPPRADALMESLRATGYSLPDAVSDLIDNSITARARNIWVNFHWAGEASWASIPDDGHGMCEEELIDAMRIASRSPREEREPSDLGRDGLGLKTASISQARSLSRTRNSPVWEFSHIAKDTKFAIQSY